MLVGPPVDAADRVVVAEVLAGAVVEGNGRVVVDVEDGTVTDAVLLSPPPQLATSAIGMTSDATIVNARLTCMRAE
ncbi:MAG: hypothetical protein E6G39_08970 [Actinobacteria bacterium]|nr:MAG: hypothetical protein E6G39_08970 [Actinomycetota bacterium]